MPHHTPLIATISVGLVLAFAFGLLAHRLKISPLVGYLMAGVAVGPFTPGFVADAELAAELAEIGVILLMFAVGLHFSLKDLMSVRNIAVPGAVVQIAVATLMGMALAWALGWSLQAGMVFGLALSVASTVVLTRALGERRLLETERGRIAVGWLVVEDLVMVVALVLLPVVGQISAGGSVSAGEVATILGITLAKVSAFVAVMLLVGRRVIPMIMHYVAHTGSRELFRLAVYALALGVAAGAASLFEVSFALGAFFAGMVMAESQLSQRATEEALPLRDAFAVLFFVSVGMLFDPKVLVEAPWAVLGTIAIIVLGKSAAAWMIVRAFGHPNGTAVTISASLAQIGEFSFILAGLGVSMKLLPEEGRDLVLAGAILSIFLNPFIFALAERRPARRYPKEEVAVAAPADASAMERVQEEIPGPGEQTATTLADHDVLIGYGRVGRIVGDGLLEAGRPVLVFDDREDSLERARAAGAEVIEGNAADPQVLALGNIAGARRLFVTVPEAFEAGQVVEQARALNPRLEIVARAHSDATVEHLSRLGANLAVMGEREIARRMLEAALPEDSELAAAEQAAGLLPVPRQAVAQTLDEALNRAPDRDAGPAPDRAANQTAG
ncbi:Potassium/proton antiporter rosB [Roseomonas mucosa]|uniref:Inner membrane protein ybaL n=1 Tax=Roseomonas mucosa TaxID=207340 RepID=A0A1S8D5M6_9PROT|nr:MULTISPECIES: YbaL family putative K(+) efflux transporter [Roseomonas]MBS5902414.1 Kef family K(+) transporter [Acetobacteraceae bacterium]AWV24025.1 Potassium/proton antiporter rosB [Roseomonas mucosa]MCG7352375.1 Kef family K(+) transporter [Roseomonas mucosa]MCG7357670.1 Kef family K(+) transporter [Roseomonas mucosa]MDT8289205.1 YbaL family putative K(+) efflux transporter [Roseomonas mucosa]